MLRKMVNAYRVMFVNYVSSNFSIAAIQFSGPPGLPGEKGEKGDLGLQVNKKIYALV